MISKINKSELICYSTDSSGIFGIADRVFFPKTVEDVQRIVKTSKDVVPRGSGNNIVGSCIPSNSVVIDTKKMNKVSYYKERVYVEAGATIKELNEKLKTVNYEFPIIDKESDTIGGMIAMNTFGYFGGYGRIKRWVEELEIVNGKGDILKLGKTDLSDICGMEGITGVITKVKLKVIPIKEKSMSIITNNDNRDFFSSIDELRNDKEVVMLRLYSPNTLKMLRFPEKISEKLTEKLLEKQNLFVVFNSDSGEIKGSEFLKILNIIKKDYFYLFSENYYNTDDYRFLSDKLKEFIYFLDKLNIPYFSDLHFNVIYPFFKNNFKCNKLREFVLKNIRKLNGHPIKYGIGLKRKNILDSLQRKVINSVKLRYDPFNKINKGKVIDFVDKVDFLDKEEVVSEQLEREPIDDRKKFISENLEIAEEIYNEISIETSKETVNNESLDDLDVKNLDVKNNAFKLSIEREKLEKQENKDFEEQNNEFFKKQTIEPEKLKKDYEIGEIMNEYEYTFKSELEKKQEVEELLKNIIKQKSLKNGSRRP